MNTVIKILIAEHDPADLELIQHQLKKEGICYIASIVQNENEYVSALELFRPDMILCNDTFPSFDAQVAFEIKERISPGIPFILVSGTLGEESAVELIKRGVTDYALKDRLLSLPIKIKRALKDATAKQEKDATAIALEQALAEVKKVLDSSPDVICAVDAAGYFVQVSAACETVWGYTADELIGRNLMDFIFLGDREESKKATLQVMAGNILTNFENRFLHKNGSWVPIVWSSSWNATNNMRYSVARDATEKKKYEKALENERQRFFDLFLQAPSCIGVLKGPGHVFENANLLYLELIGKKDIIGRSVEEVMPGLKDQGFTKILDDVYETGESFFAIERLIQLDVKGNGNLVDMYLNLVYQPYKNSEGNIEGIFFFINDVTENVLYRKKLEESEHQYRQIVETAQEGIWFIDENSNTILVNKKMCDIIGYSQEEMTGEKIYQLMDDEWKIKAADHIVQRKLGLSESFDFKYISKSGKDVWTSVTTNPVFDNAGMFKGTLAMVIDITARKKNEAEIIKRDNQLTLAAEMARLAYWEHDIVKDVFTFNDQFYAIFKTTAEKVGGYTMPSARYAELFVHPDDRDIVAKSVAEAMRSNDSGFSFKAEHRIIYADGEMGYISVHFYIVKDEKGRTVKNYGVNQDITESKLAKIRLHQLNINLQKHVKELAMSNAELEQFAFITSHDLQEPLRMVTSFLALIEKNYGELIDDTGKKYIAFAVDGAKHMKQIMLDILDFSRVGRMENKLETVDLNQLIKEIQVLSVGNNCDQTASILADLLPVILTYKSPVRQVFQNLIGNAVKYCDKKRPLKIYINASESATHWQFSVSDNGIGINKEYFNKIFIIFQRLHNNPDLPGTGMGLAITKKIVENLGGEIWVESEEGKGSTFNFTLLKH
jgi:PAS domain S-box-containing protein